MSMFSSLEFDAEQIRLLTFRGKNNDGLLEFLLETANIYERPFVALSYTWDSPQLRIPIPIADLERPIWRDPVPLSHILWELVKDETLDKIMVNGATYFITSNLYHFLVTLLRPESRVRTMQLYIDQICINLDDVDERSRQVATMGKIFSQAVEVIAWPGPSFYASSNCLIPDLDEKDEEHLDVLKSILASTTSYAGHHMGDRELVDLAGAMVACMLSAYWSRQWIVQEVIHAKKLTIRMKDHEFDWQILLNLGAWLAGLRSDVASVFDTVTETFTGPRQIPNADRQTFGGGWLIYCCLKTLQYKLQEKKSSERHVPKSIYQILDRLGNRRCKHQRDKIFSLFSLSDTKVVPDYTKPVRLIFLEVLTEGLLESAAAWDKEKDNHVQSKTANFTLFVIQACGLEMWNPTVLLLVSRTLERCGIDPWVRSTERVSPVEWVWLFQKVSLPDTAPLTLGFLGITANGTILDYVTKELESAKATDGTFGFPEIDHQSGTLSLVTKTYTQWLELVDEVVSSFKTQSSFLDSSPTSSMPADQTADTEN